MKTTVEDIRAMEAALAVQATTYDEHCMRWCVARREARVDVHFRILDRDGAVAHPDMEPLWAFTGLVTEDGLRLVVQNPGPGEDATELLPSLARHLEAHPTVARVDPTDVRYLRVGGYSLRARRFNRGVVESVRVDVQVRWKDGAPPSWMHAFDGDLVFSPFSRAPEFRVTAKSVIGMGGWGGTELLAHYAVFASLVSRATSAEVMAQLARAVAWGADETVFKVAAPSPPEAADAANGGT